MATLKNNQGRFSINGLEYDEITVIVEALNLYKGFLEEMLSESTTVKNYYVEWSICLQMWVEFNKKVTNHIALPQRFGKTVALHELFVLQEALLIYQPNGRDKYQENVCRSLIMLINPALPRLKQVRLESRNYGN